MTTTQATRIKIYKNETTGYALTTVSDAYGVTHVTDTEGFHATTIDPAHAETILWERSLLHDAKPWQGEPPTMASPLAPEHRVRPSNLARGSSLTTMTTAQATAAHLAAMSPEGTVLREHTTASVLRAMARREWLELDHDIRPTCGTLTAAGRNALAAYDAKNQIRGSERDASEGGAR